MASVARERRRAKPFKACRVCHSLVPKNAERCPVCGSTDLTEEWEGLVVIIDMSSVVVEKLPFKVERPGRYALRVE